MEVRDLILNQTLILEEQTLAKTGGIDVTISAMPDPELLAQIASDKRNRCRSGCGRNPVGPFSVASLLMGGRTSPHVTVVSTGPRWSLFMDERMTDAGMADLYEEMLYARAAKGIRPVLYVSSRKDLECSVLMLLNEAPEVKLSGRQPRAAIGFGQHVRTT